MANSQDLINSLTAIGLGLSPVITLVVVVFIITQLAHQFRVHSAGNEWLLVIRNGQLVRSGIGCSAWKLPRDQVVRFPSLIQQVNFSVTQVSQEMQGTQLSGMLIWNVMRSNDGPMNCYKFFGDDLKKSTPVDANKQIEALAVAIFRDRIANLTIKDIMKNRHKLRGGVKEEMQKILTGWGIWLETCEIMDVKVTSKSLFVNMQTEFRETERSKAEKIQAETQNIINEQSLVRTTAFSKQKADSDNKIKNENLKRTTEFQKTEAESNNALRHEQMQRDTTTEKKQAENDQSMKDTTLQHTTEYQKTNDDITNETKKINFERNTKFGDHVANTRHTQKQAALNRTTAYDKLETDTNYLQYSETLERDTAYNNKAAQVNTTQKIFASDSTMKQTQHAAELYKKELSIQQKRHEDGNKTQIHTAELNLLCQKKQMEFNASKDTYQTELAIVIEEDQLKLKNVQFDGRKIDVLGNLELAQMKFAADQELTKKEYQIKDQGYTPKVLYSMVLEAAKSIYNSRSLKDVSVVTMNGGENNSLVKAVAQYKAISEVMESN